MADASSVIRVSIIGDASKLTGALDKGQSKLGGFVKGAGLALGGLVAVDKGMEFLQGATQEADRLGDALTRLNISIGKTNTDELRKTADQFLRLGLSSQDVLELSANFADLGVNAGISQPKIAGFADDVAATAAAMSLLDKSDPSANVENIGKAAEGNAKALRALGININEDVVTFNALVASGKASADQLTAGEKATARLALVLDALKPKLDAATSGSGDLEQSQRELQARVEQLQGELGGPLSDALVAVTGFILDEIKALPHAIEGFQMLGKGIHDFAAFVLGPLAAVNDLIGNIGDNIATANANASRTPRTPRGPAGSSGVPSDSSTVRAVQRTTERRGGLGNSLGGP